MPSANLSPHFTLAEATTTLTGIPNNPDAAQLERALNTAYNMEIVRAILERKPITITSWIRVPAVNTAVGGAPGSEHLLGAAVDFKCPSFGSPEQICRALLQCAHILNYNQLILESTWVHISFPPDGIRGKREVLTIRNGQTLQGLVP